MESKQSANSLTITQTQLIESQETKSLTLRLRGKPERRVSWEPEVVNNEGLGRKKSKSELII